MSEKRPTILLAEDDLNLGVLLADFLDAEGFEVKLCKDGDRALSVFTVGSFDLCLLDVMMPKIDGFTLAKEIRKSDSLVPIIFITARSLKEDKSMGYELGADDYITKPFDEEELLWKIKALIRRAPDKQVQKSDLISIGMYQFDPANQALLLNGELKRITEKESEILCFLYTNRNRVIKREEMLTALWGENDYFLGRSLDVFITKIRKYLSQDTSLSIDNVFKVGFIFNVPG